MKKIGKIVEFNGRQGIINDNIEEFDFHILDISNQKNQFELENGTMVEFRAEYRPELKRAKNIKVLVKNSTDRNH